MSNYITMQRAASALLMGLACFAPVLHAADHGLALSEDDKADDRNTFDAAAWWTFPSRVSVSGSYTIITDDFSKSCADEATLRGGYEVTDCADVLVGGFVSGNLGGKRIQDGWHRTLGADLYGYGYQSDTVYRPLIAAHLHRWGVDLTGQYLGNSAWAMASTGITWDRWTIAAFARNWWGDDYSEAARVYHRDAGKIGLTATVRIGAFATFLTYCQNDIRSGVSVEW